MPKPFIIIAFFVFLIPSSVQAQTTTELFNSFAQSGTSYRGSYSAYTQAKNQHLQYNTGATRNTAIEKTVEVLKGRNSWQISYLRFLRQKLAEATNIANYPQTVTYLDLETEINALNGLAYSSGEQDSFPKINAASQGWETRLKKTDVLVAAAKLQIASARLASLQTQVKTELQSLEGKVGTPSATTKSTLSLINQKLDSSIALRESVDNSLGTRLNTDNFRQSLQKIHTDLAEASRLLLELGYQYK